MPLVAPFLDYVRTAGPSGLNQIFSPWPRSDFFTTEWTAKNTSNLTFLNQIWATFICGSKSDTDLIFWNATSVWIAMWPVSEFSATLTSLLVDIWRHFTTNVEDGSDGGRQWSILKNKTENTCISQRHVWVTSGPWNVHTAVCYRSHF